MASKKKLTTFRVGFVVSVWFDRDVEAETFEDAFAKAKAMKYSDIVKDLESHSCNDCHYDVVQVFQDDLFKHHGF